MGGVRTPREPPGGPPGDRPDDPGDAEALARHATALAEAVDAAIPGWVARAVRGILDAQGIPVDPALAAEIEAAGERARADGAPRVRRLLAADVDEQAGNPLAVLRGLVRYPTAVLQAAGARPVARDDFR